MAIKFLPCWVFILVLTACSSDPEIVPTGPDTYNVNERRGIIEGGAAEAKRVALTRAGKYCQASNTQLFTVAEHEGGPTPYGNTNYDLTFRCAAKAGNSSNVLPLNETHFRVTVYGKSRLDVENLLLLNAAEIALTHGYNDFNIEAATNASVVETAHAAGSSTKTTISAFGRGNNAGLGFEPANTSYSLPYADVQEKPGAVAVVILTPQGDYSALPLYQKLAVQYGFPSAPPPPENAASNVSPTVSLANDNILQGSREAVAMAKDGGTFRVAALINDTITLSFVIDSGAADVSIPRDVFSTLMRSGAIRGSDLIGKQTFIMANGAKEHSQTFRIASLKIGHKTVENVMASVTSEKGELLLGQSFLSRLHYWSIDNQSHALMIE